MAWTSPNPATVSSRAWTSLSGRGTEDTFSYDGDYFSFPEVRVIPKPVQQPHPPIFMAVTHSPESVEIAVRNRWGLFTVGSSFFPASPDSDQNLINLYRRRMLEEGTAPDDIEVAAVRNVYVAPTDEEAIELLVPRLQWAGDMGDFLRRPLSTLCGPQECVAMSTTSKTPLSSRIWWPSGARKAWQPSAAPRRSRQPSRNWKRTTSPLHQLPGCRGPVLRPGVQLAATVRRKSDAQLPLSPNPPKR